MGCHVFLLVIVICGLPPAYITVFGYGGCQQGQAKVTCLENDISPEKTCPGVGVFCASGDRLCGCAGTLYRNNKFKCVSYGDCVEREYDSLAGYEEHSNKIEERTHEHCKWKRKKLFLTFWLQNKNHTYLRYFLSGPGSPQKMPGNLQVVHANANCLITGTHSNKYHKFDCTMWTRKSLVGHIPEDCDFIFKANCQNAQYILSNLDVCFSAYA
uniref:Putative lipocalin lipocalin n=1 Tax=Rhipicephalus microplus TaxID=6941 RepID=A0A6G5A421_RHIMP